MLIAGVDEAGRGSCLGPMVLAIAVIEKRDEPKLLELGVKDSKLLSPAARKMQFPEIKRLAREHGCVHLSAAELDSQMARHSLNEIEAMKVGQLLNNLKEAPDLVYIDCPDILTDNFEKRVSRYLSCSTILKAEHKADLNYPVVSAASVIAKVERDSAIEKLAGLWGEVGSGYPSDEVTIKFIKNYLTENRSLPDFVRVGWQTNQRILDEHYQKKLW